MMSAYYIVCRYSSTRCTQLVRAGVMGLGHTMFYLNLQLFLFGI